jgi:hypothetical protein
MTQGSASASIITEAQGKFRTNFSNFHLLEKENLLIAHWPSSIRNEKCKTSVSIHSNTQICIGIMLFLWNNNPSARVHGKESKGFPDIREMERFTIVTALHVKWYSRTAFASTAQMSSYCATGDHTDQSQHTHRTILASNASILRGKGCRPTKSSFQGESQSERRFRAITEWYWRWLSRMHLILRIDCDTKRFFICKWPLAALHWLCLSISLPTNGVLRSERRQSLISGSAQCPSGIRQLYSLASPVPCGFWRSQEWRRISSAFPLE